ncbi:MAG: efflux RND transporter periplasmic adaptor subunit [Planctomycetes bacterium]|nr:efflux RND transporter periplasmic adaptor subunit [Planctomycetota bacterium]
MSEVKSDVDLGRLSRTRESALSPPKRSWRRFSLPIAILAGFVALLIWSLGDALLPKTRVRVVRPRVTTAQRAPQGAVAFAAAGWVEPDPFAIHVTALTPGVIAKILVEESDRVTEGQPIAELVPDDAKLALEAVERALAVARSNAEEKRIALDFAQQDFDARIELDERLAVTKAELAGKTAEHADMAASVDRLLADVRAAEEEVTVQNELRSKGAGGVRQVELAEARLDSTRSALHVAKAKAAHALAQVDVARARAARVSKDAELRIEDRRRVEAAKTAHETALREIEAAQNRIAIAALAVERLVVRAPMDGVVLERHVGPGEGAPAGGICSLYDPAHLRVRVDVPQEQIASAGVGQHAQILSEARPGKPYRGEVIRVIDRADIQKVTLEVQVRVLDPDGLLRPEMLCQVRFEAVQQSEPEAGQGQKAGDANDHSGDASTSQRPGRGEAGAESRDGHDEPNAADSRALSSAATRVLWIPQACIVQGRVFVIDPDGPRARVRPVVTMDTAGAAPSTGLVAVTSGLDISDKVVVDPPARLADGDLVEITGEETGGGSR